MLNAQVALVGKGLTFDTGGYNLKTSGGIETMKCDMGGAAAVLGAARALRDLRPQGVQVWAGTVRHALASLWRQHHAAACCAHVFACRLSACLPANANAPCISSPRRVTTW